MADIVIYTRPKCHFCKKLKDFLKAEGLAYSEVDLAAEPSRQQELEKKTKGIGSVPQLFVGDEHVGDCFFVLSESGQAKLAGLLSAAARTKA